MIEATI